MPMYTALLKAERGGRVQGNWDLKSWRDAIVERVLIENAHPDRPLYLYGDFNAFKTFL